MSDELKEVIEKLKSEKAKKEAEEDEQIKTEDTKVESEDKIEINEDTDDDDDKDITKKDEKILQEKLEAPDYEQPTEEEAIASQMNLMHNNAAFRYELVFQLQKQNTYLESIKNSLEKLSTLV